MALPTTYRIQRGCCNCAHRYVSPALNRIVCVYGLERPPQEIDIFDDPDWASMACCISTDVYDRTVSPAGWCAEWSDGAPRFGMMDE